VVYLISPNISFSESISCSFFSADITTLFGMPAILATLIPKL